MTVDQLIFDYLFQLSLNSGYSTYDHLPLETENAPYPFVVIGSVQTLPVVTKNALQGQLVANVDVWGDGEGRFKVSQMMNDIFVQASQPVELDGYSVRLKIDDYDNQIMQDTSVPNTVLNHGMMTLVFNLN
ncbi:hypothetical protein AYP76_06020 [Ligilactobacillus agilis]|uniref:DUF3168 domain-containing protein n=1 Tax=Ligilactobacillus agilis TaxID=1601 RepID=A0A226RH09_9LACO|nr:hypothetical protein [Ligilactobacillus agilis]MCL8204049.1 DUF3168 domain-containing protein [Ligilactobacillus agilis]OXC06777.1 hypothetical protein AYP74_01305 [Ligilactobacillus agilis]OXC08502.1 hypothetical protein AYP76_06020 [Ligilactobacillus agilis]OXC11473.1 hypothetical protein AYP75_04225 [Ligilactobacillus agilis]OXS41537.1 hypothetical protein AYP69_02585 [Ligilactobacillus agilis]